MRKIAVANQKGGCAKTTTVVNLAAALAEQGSRVLVVDLDPQGNATQWLNGESASKGSFSLLTSAVPADAVCVESSVAGVSLISASQELANIEQALSGKLAVESILRRKLALLSAADWDYLLVDTPPTLGILTLNALVACSELLIPVTTHVMTLSGVAQLMTSVTEVTELLNPDLVVLGFVASRFDARTRHSKDVLVALKERFGSKVLNSIIRENIRIAEAPSFNQSALVYDGKGGGADDYRSLATEIINIRVRK